MNIGLVDVDGRIMRGKKRNGQRFPNLALMKLSAFHKAQGDEVEAAYAVSRGLAKSELHSLFHMAECVKDEAVRVVERVELARAIVARVYGKDEAK